MQLLANCEIIDRINLSDPVFRGEYHGKQAHEDDLDDVVQRARDVGCSKFMVTGSDLVESKHAVNIASKYRQFRTCQDFPFVY